MEAWGVLAIVVVLIGWFGPYVWGRAHHRLVAMGKNTYIRFYPNPGVGIGSTHRRLAVSVVGGLEFFRRHPQHPEVWQRTFALASRVQRPGGLR